MHSPALSVCWTVSVIAEHSAHEVHMSCTGSASYNNGTCVSLFRKRCQDQLVMCHVHVKCWLPRPHSLAGFWCQLVNLLKKILKKGNTRTLWLFDSTPVPGGKQGNEGEKLEEEHAKWISRERLWPVWGHRGVFTLGSAVCHSSVPTTATFFPTGLNLSRDCVRVRGSPHKKDSMVVREV